jgi:hypothetical protein
MKNKEGKNNRDKKSHNKPKENKPTKKDDNVEFAQEFDDKQKLSTNDIKNDKSHTIAKGNKNQDVRFNSNPNREDPHNVISNSKNQFR